MSDETLALTTENVEKVLDELRPFLMADGGNVEIAEIDGPIVKVRPVSYTHLTLPTKRIV